MLDLNRWPSIESGAQIIRAGNLTQDLETQEVRVDGRVVCLTNQEFELLSLLIERKNLIVPQDTLCRAIWGKAGPREAKRLTVIVARLRDILADSYPFVIETVRLRGYGLVSAIQQHAMSPSPDPAGMHDWHSDSYVMSWISLHRDDRETAVRRLIDHIPFDANHEIEVLDVGGGYGPLTRQVMEAFPRARVVMHDYSEQMRNEARRRLARFGDAVSFVDGDLPTDSWSAAVGGPFDVILSTDAIHNVRFPRRIRDIYREIGALLKPSGCFIFLDRIALTDYIASVERHRHEIHRFSTWDDEPNAPVPLPAGRGRTRRTVTITSPLPPSSMVEEEPATVFNQMKWLMSSGFDEVECFWRDEHRALIGAYRVFDRHQS